MRSGSGGALNFLRGATGPLIGLILLGAFLSLTTDTFLTLRNFLNVMDQVTVLGVMAVGMTLVILIGGIDLSVGSVLALSGMVMGFVGNHHGLPFGIEFSARKWRDGDLISWAYDYEQHTHHRRRPVLVEGGMLPKATKPLEP